MRARPPRVGAFLPGDPALAPYAVSPPLLPLWPTFPWPGGRRWASTHQALSSSQQPAWQRLP
eukprot:7230591-Lingulodinium_polyedra.AAC.1